MQPKYYTLLISIVLFVTGLHGLASFFNHNLEQDTNKVYVTYHYKSKEHSVTDSMVYSQKTCDWGFHDTNELDWKIKDQLAETYPDQDFEKVLLEIVPLAQHKRMLENNQ